MPVGDLLTLSDLKTRLGIDPTDTRKDDQHTAAISAASTAIFKFSGRDFGSPTVQEVRTYQYDGAGVLDIDDAQSVTSVVIEVGDLSSTTVPTDQWFAQPHITAATPVHTYIILPPGVGVFGSPAMGFERNLDVLYAEGWYSGPPPVAKVDALWGWTEVPEDIKQAAVWTIEEFAASSDEASESLAAESIEGYSRSWQKQMEPTALPNRAKELLYPYLKWTF